jgi:hypothetical protein
MKRIIGLTTAALMGASMVVAPALAQTSDGASDRNVPTPGMSESPPTAPGTGGTDTMQDGAASTMPDVDAGTTAAIAPTFDGALGAIGGNSASAQSIGSMSEISAVNVVKIDELEGADAAAVDSAVTENEAGVTELRTSIEANAALSQELETQGVEASSVVAAQVEADGALTLYVM